MEKRVALELRGRNPSQVKELNLDNCRGTNIEGLTDEYINLEILSLNNVGLTSLKGFPTLPKLRKLELSDNRISNGLNFLSCCKKITHLNLSGNKIKDLETLKPLENFMNLRTLDLFNNDVTQIENYRSKVFALHPSLKYLDGFDKEDMEAEDDSDEDEMNGNNDTDDDDEEEEEEDLDIDFGSLLLDDEALSERPAESRTALPLVLYTVYGLLMHMGLLLRSSDEDGLSAVYKENLEEESSGGSLYDGSDVEEEEDIEEEDADADNDADADADAERNNKRTVGDEDSEPEESTRGKKRKHEDEDEN